MDRLHLLRALALLVALTLSPPQEAEAKRWGADYLSNATVVDQNGRTLRFYDDVIKGKTVVISFIFTSCRSICPLVTARLAQLERQLGPAAGRDVFFVSLSIDPTTDTPERLKEFSRNFEPGPSWAFLTGDESVVKAIGYRLGERTEQLADHRNQILLYNDRTGEWQRSSAFADLDALALQILAMDPLVRATKTPGDDIFGGGDGPMRPEFPGQALFVKFCAACHTVGAGRRVGPDLRDVNVRRPREWTARYVQNPEAMRAAGDPLVQALRAEYPHAEMPGLNLAHEDVQDLLLYVDLKSSECSASEHEAAK